jgi:hypothetical protein
MTIRLRAVAIATGVLTSALIPIPAATRPVTLG